MQGEYSALEVKNQELSEAFGQKARSLGQITKLYQALKAQVMASHVAHAAGNEAEITLQTARGDRFIDRLPGTRTGTAQYSHMGVNQRTGGVRLHNRADSRSSGDSGQHRQGIGLSQHYAPHLQSRGLVDRVGSSRMSTASLWCALTHHSLETAPVGTPGHSPRSRLPVLGGKRHNVLLNHGSGPSYPASPMTRQALGSISRNVGNMGSFTLGGQGKKPRRLGGAANMGPLGR